MALVFLRQCSVQHRRAGGRCLECPRSSDEHLRGLMGQGVGVKIGLPFGRP